MLNRLIAALTCIPLLFLISWPVEAAQAEIHATTIDGGKMIIPEKGKKTAVHFWTSWCPPCKEELPQFQKFYEENKNRTQLITVNLTSQEKSKESVSRFLKEYHLTLPVVLDPDGRFMNLYRIVTIPTTYLYNEDGKLENVIVGPMTSDQLHSWSAKKIRK
ncbi:endospore biogenesis thiol-disulfide oxidoreductase StoA [Bacillus gobiensis]|uniref:endospore biogenesis thiol-disulfide oxidoreductase StoA n=1 Tax=Bacillus gobiensis TaxID=1441095 RepID=UPI003D241D8C